VCLNLQLATTDDATVLATLHNEVANHLTAQYGPGPWSGQGTERSVLCAMRVSRVFVAWEDSEVVATFRLATKKPWAIDTSYFTPVGKPLYLLAMAVAPAKQRQGIGCQCLKEARRLGKAWPADAIRLDAFDTKAGAGEFYARCGFTEKGRVSYKGNPLIYYEVLLTS
jgi:GNAT superfamily N-acetyltransferase